MVYYTQLIFIKTGKEAEFHAFEHHVLPLLSDYNGELVYRIRPDGNSFVAAADELPYEIHLVTFKSGGDFENYKNDPRRLAFMDLKNRSVEKIILIEGKAL
jgi:hypothetical protein